MADETKNGDVVLLKKCPPKSGETRAVRIDENDATLSNVSGTGTYGGAGTLTATLTTGGAPLSGKSVAFTLSGDAVGSATISIDAEDIGLVVVTLTGPGRVDDLAFEAD